MEKGRELGERKRERGKVGWAREINEKGMR